MNWFANCESVLEDIIRVLENFLKLSSSIVKGMMERLMHLQKLLEYKSELHTYLEKLFIQCCGQNLSIVFDITKKCPGYLRRFKFYHYF